MSGPFESQREKEDRARGGDIPTDAEKIEDLRSQLAQEKGLHKQSKGTLHGVLEERDAAVSNMESSARGWEARIATLEKERVAERARDLDIHRREITEAHYDRDAAQEKVDALDSALRVETEKINVALKQLSEMAQRAVRLRGEREAGRTRIAELEKELGEVRREYAFARADWDLQPNGLPQAIYRIEEVESERDAALKSLAEERQRCRNLSDSEEVEAERSKAAKAQVLSLSVVVEKIVRAVGMYKTFMISEGHDTCPRTRWAKELEEALALKPDLSTLKDWEAEIRGEVWELIKARSELVGDQSAIVYAEARIAEAAKSKTGEA